MLKQPEPEPTSFPVIGFTHWEHIGGRLMYIADRPRKIRVKGKLIPKPGGFADWEYTERPEKAMPLSRYWWRRFRHDSHYCGHCAHYYPCRKGLATAPVPSAGE